LVLWQYKKTEQYEDEITSGLVKSYGDVLGLLGEDPERKD
jgi:GTP cyclohydrolase I